MNEEKKVVKADESGKARPPCTEPGRSEAEPKDARNLHLNVLYRQRVFNALRTVERLLAVCGDELDAAVKVAGNEVGDTKLVNELLHAQNWTTLAKLHLPDLGTMEQKLEHARLLALIHPAVCPPVVSPSNHPTFESRLN